MSNIIPMGSQSADTIGEVRNYAREMEDFFLYVRKHAVEAQGRVHRAKTIEKVVYAYARYLEHYHSNAISPFLANYALPPEQALSKRHADAIEAIRAAVAALENEIRQKLPWLHLPNLNRTRWGMEATLFRIIKATDAGLENCLVLKGLEPDERISA